MKKTIIAAIAAGVLLAGCGSGSTDSAPPQTTPVVSSSATVPTEAAAEPSTSVASPTADASVGTPTDAEKYESCLEVKEFAQLIGITDAETLIAGMKNIAGEKDEAGNVKATSTEWDQSSPEAQAAVIEVSTMAMSGGC